MKNKPLHVLLLLISIGWVVFTFIPVYAPFASLGKIFMHPNGIYSRELPDDAVTFEDAGIDCNIALDELGVPTIKGKSANDVAFGMGFMQARDRYFQMELITRTVQGRLCEILGDLTLERDLFWRPLGADSLARRDLENLKKNDKEVYEYVSAYNEGVRFYLEQEGRKERFMEYTLLGERPREWKDHYPLLLSYYMSEVLAYDDMGLSWSSNFDKMSSQTYNLFFNNDFTKDYEYIYQDTFRAKIFEPVVADTLLDSLQAQVFDADKFQAKKGIGSNNWAVSKKKSKTGNAILCNDTHLDITMPNPWYQVHLICDDFHVQGFSIPCVPYVLSGNNENIAWGITNGYWDEVELFNIELNDDSSGYKVNGQNVPFTQKKHVIEVKGSDDRIIVSKYCDHGIVKRSDSGMYYTEKWYALDFESSVFAFDKVMRARNWNEFRNGVRQFTFPPQNFAYADKEGNVGMVSAGKMPARSAEYRGQMLDGTVPFKPEFLDFEEIPQAFKGDSGYVSSANQMQGRSNYFINYFWGEPYRAERINNFLESKKQLIADDMKILHLDKVDVSARKTLSLYDSLSLGKERTDWITDLRGWNGEMNPILKTPVKYTLLSKSLNKVVIDELKKEGVDWWPEYYKIIEVLGNNDTVTFGSGNVLSSALLVNALDTAMFYYDKVGADTLEYGESSDFQLRHLLRIPGLGRTVAAKGGNAFTVDVNGRGVHGASMRTIIELGDTPGVQTVLAGGQSGRVNSPHYDDQIEMWSTGQYNMIPFGTNVKESKEASIVFKKGN